MFLLSYQSVLKEHATAERYRPMQQPPRELQFKRELPPNNMDDRTIDLIFAGSLESLPPVSSKIVRIFTSSTFTGKISLSTKTKKIHAKYCVISDTTMERNTLMAQCYPKLKDYCREKHGLEFQVTVKKVNVGEQ